MAELTTTRLADLIGKRRRRLTQLRDLGRKQAEVVAAGGMADLLRMLAAKQELISGLEQLEVELRPFHAQEADEREWPSLDERARCAEDAEACRLLIQEVIAIEQSCEQQMTVRRDEVAKRLTTLAASGRAQAAYEANR